MEPATIIALSIALLDLIIIPVGAAVWYYYRDRVKNERLREAVDIAVLAADELSAASEKRGDSKWGSGEKLDFVWRRIEKEFPKIDRQKLEILIHASLKALNLGASAFRVK